jgi:hypothetical protein
MSTQPPATMPAMHSLDETCPRCRQHRPHICYGAHVSGPPVVRITRQRPDTLETAAKRIA